MLRSQLSRSAGFFYVFPGIILLKPIFTKPYFHVIIFAESLEKQDFAALPPVILTGAKLTASQKCPFKQAFLLHGKNLKAKL